MYLQELREEGSQGESISHRGRKGEHVNEEGRWSWGRVVSKGKEAAYSTLGQSCPCPSICGGMSLLDRDFPHKNKKQRFKIHIIYMYMMCVSYTTHSSAAISQTTDREQQTLMGLLDEALF